jgi:transcriptional regulator with XRE-family HTH domain
MASTALGLKIFELRKVKKLTQTELGKLLGISGVAVSQFEKGANKPSYETIVKLSEILDFDFNPLYIESYTTRALSNSKTHPIVDGSARPEEVYIGNPFVPLPVLSIANFIKYCLLKNPFPLNHLSFPDSVGIAHHRLPSLSTKGVSYKDSIILEIQGNSMAPRYPSESWHVAQLVDKDHWQHATGVHAIWLKSHKLFIRRIISNKQGVMILSADATKEQSTVSIEEIESLWKLGQSAHMPPEE